MAGMLVAYMVVGCWLFTRGLSYVAALPGVGEMLQERILFMIFFLFFVMLIFSNGILLYIGAFRNKQTSWLLSMPFHPQAIFAGKLFESLVFSSWGLVALSAPILIACGQTHDAGFSFYLKSVALILAFIAVPASIAGAALCVMTRWWPRGVWPNLAFVASVVGFGIWKNSQRVPSVAENEDAAIASAQLAIGDALHHTEIATHPMLPSTWVTEAVLGWLGLARGNGMFHSMLTLSYALMAILVACWSAKYLFIPAWSRLAKRNSHRSDETTVALQSRGLIPAGALRRRLALLRKDNLSFLRDPAQWVQSAIIIGLLIVYILNIRNMGYDYESSLWSTVICYLNFTVCSLALSTLTTRFVFPQFSLEGQRLWIIGMAPLAINSLVWQKFFQALLVTGLTTGVLMILSGIMLELPVSRIAYLAIAMLLLCIGLNGLSVGLGALFPNFRETNAAKMVSGFGGTLCLVASFILIVATVTLIAMPDILNLIGSTRGQRSYTWLTPSVSLSTCAVICIGTAISVLVPATRYVKKLDF